MSGSHWINSLATTVATPAKKCGRKASSRPTLGRALGHDAGGEAFRIHGFDRRRPDQIGLELRKRGEIGGKGARIGAEVLVRRELGRIDEDRDDDAVGAALRDAAPAPDGRHAARPWSAPARWSCARRARNLGNRARKRRQCADDAQRDAADDVSIFRDFVCHRVAARAHPTRFRRRVARLMINLSQADAVS